MKRHNSFLLIYVMLALLTLQMGCKLIPTTGLSPTLTVNPTTASLPPTPMPDEENMVTPSRLIPIPAPIFDDFNTNLPGYAYDTRRWDVGADDLPDSWNVVQEKGYLRLSLSSQKWGGIGMDAIPYIHVPLKTIGMMGVRMLLSCNYLGGPSSVQMKVHTGKKDVDAMMWRIAVAPDESSVIQAGRFVGGDVDWDPLVYESAAQCDTWYTVWITLNADTGEYEFYLDGEEVGTIMAADDPWNNPNTAVGVSFWASVDRGVSAIYYLDDFSIAHSDK